MGKSHQVKKKDLSCNRLSPFIYWIPKGDPHNTHSLSFSHKSRKKREIIVIFGSTDLFIILFTFPAFEGIFQQHGYNLAQAL